MRLYALRGAITVERNDAEEILLATTELLETLIERNDLVIERIVSCIFTLTEDLNAEFPAVAARAIGFNGVPLLCAREVDVPHALPRVVRVMVHYYAEEGVEPKHVYLRDAVALRSDIAAAQ